MDADACAVRCVVQCSTVPQHVPLSVRMRPAAHTHVRTHTWHPILTLLLLLPYIHATLTVDVYEQPCVGGNQIPVWTHIHSMRMMAAREDMKTGMQSRSDVNCG